MKFTARLSWVVLLGLISHGPAIGQEQSVIDSESLQWNDTHGVLHSKKRTEPPLRVRLGNENIREIYEACSRAPIAVVANATSVIGEGLEGSPVHLVDTLLAMGIEVKKVFAPEHGFRGDLHNGADFDDSVDAKTGLPILSLHGKSKKPSPESLADVRMVLFDVQDVGTRFYTYLSSLFLVMEAAAENEKVVVVLDRPNPNGHQMAGPILDMQWKSFVAMLPLPVMHGMTLGEMAQMINGEGWLSEGRHCDLIVIPCEGYAHSDRWFPTIAPSPNLPNAASIALYPSLCPLEPTHASIGRGTDLPFQCVGVPGNSGGDFTFTPMPMPGAAPHPKNEGIVCRGRNLRELGLDWSRAEFGFDWKLVWEMSQSWGIEHEEEFITSREFLSKLCGTEALGKALSQKAWPAEMPSTWRDELITFQNQRAPYLLYPLLR